MKTVNDIMYLINGLFFVVHLEEAAYKEFDCVRVILVDEFQDLYSDKLTNMLGILDEIYFWFRTQEVSQLENKVK